MKVTYSDDLKVAFFDGHKFRKDAKTGYYLATKNTRAGKRERLHVYVWQRYNGKLPDGYHVHHIDGDKTHNDIDNLAAVSKRKHASFHGRERWEREPENMMKNFTAKGVSTARTWHGSEAGRKWHSEHAKQTIQNMGKQEYVCQNCGKKFFALPIGSEKKYCSNACKSAARRDSGVDAEKRVCAVCGREFYVDKYTRTKTCSRQCGNILRRNTMHQAVREATSFQYGG